jgi:hypothetical protein
MQITIDITNSHTHNKKRKNATAILPTAMPYLPAAPLHHPCALPGHHHHTRRDNPASHLSHTRQISLKSKQTYRSNLQPAAAHCRSTSFQPCPIPPHAVPYPIEAKSRSRHSSACLHDAMVCWVTYSIQPSLISRCRAVQGLEVGRVVAVLSIKHWVTAVLGCEGGTWRVWRRWLKELGLCGGSSGGRVCVFA